MSDGKATRPLVSVVIPGRNCARTLPACLRALRRVRGARSGAPMELLFVDDGSTDDSAAVAAAEGAVVIVGDGRGPGAARNRGWRAASADLVWFVDSDCEVDSGALEALLPHLEDPSVGAVGGAYDNGCRDSLVARLIHEEIALRHRAMQGDVNFLASFSVVYRRGVLEQLGGFDERYLKGQDAELSFRTLAAGYKLRFENASRAAHFHERRLFPYLRTQYKQGYWRAFLHLEHGGHAGGDSYSRLTDHLQPPCALLGLAAAPLGLLPSVGVWAAAPLAALAALQIPIMIRLVRPAGITTALCFGGMSWLRAFWRGVGFANGIVAKACGRGRAGRA
ncbi:MAG: putative glycosyltransferase EpsH [Planctomycetota bacterium]|jgi:glycosyltransferase involved in cell wall biosynthesis